MTQEKTASKIQMRDFAGLVLNIDPADVRPGTSQEQTNITCARPAMLELRAGVMPVRYEDQ